MKRSSLQSLLILLLMTLFITGSAFVILYGSQFYTNMIKESKISVNRQSILLYFNNRIKQHDGQGLLSIITQDNIQALVLVQDGYTTLIYERDGHLVEQSSESAEIKPLEAQNILELTELTFTLENHGITITYKDQTNQTVTLKYTLNALELPS